MFGYQKRSSSARNGLTKWCVEVVYIAWCPLVPKLSYNLLSMAKASRNGKIVKFTEFACYVLDRRHKMIANRVVPIQPHCQYRAVSSPVTILQ